MKRRLLMVGRSRYALPLSEPLARKFDALGRELDVRVLATAGGGRGTDARFRLFRPLPLGKLEGAAFYALLPFRVARELRSFHPDAVLVAGRAGDLARPARAGARALAGEGRARRARRLARADAALRLAAPAGLRARSATRSRGSAVRKADAVRTISDYTSGLVRAEGVEPAAVFPAFMDLEPFLESEPAPLPERPVALFVGVLERYKAVDVLAEAWRRAAPSRARRRAPDRRPRDDERRSSSASSPSPPVASRGRASLPGDAVAGALDAATVLVLPSRSEGLGRVVVEAFCRGRGVVGSQRRRDPRSRHGRRDRDPRAARGRRRARRRARPRPLRPGSRGATRRRGARRRSSRGWRPRRTTRVAMRELVDAGRWRVVRLVVVTQQVDPASPVLGATVAKLGALAARVDELVVLADSAVDGVLPENARVRLFRSGTKAGRGIRFEAALAAELAGARGPPPCSRTCARSTPCSPLRSRGRSVRASCSGSRTGARAACSGSRSGSRRRLSRSTAARSRCRRESSSRSGTESTWPTSAASSDIATTGFGCSRSAARRPRRGSTRSSVPSREVPEATLIVHGPSLTDEERRHRAELESARRRARARRPRDARRARPARARPGADGGGRRARQQHARRRAGQGRLRGGRDVSAGARVEPGLCRASFATSCVSHERTRPRSPHASAG